MIKCLSAILIFLLVLSGVGEAASKDKKSRKRAERKRCSEEFKLKRRHDSVIERNLTRVLQRIRTTASQYSAEELAHLRKVIAEKTKDTNVLFNDDFETLLNLANTFKTLHGNPVLSLQIKLELIKEGDKKLETFIRELKVLASSGQATVFAVIELLDLFDDRTVLKALEAIIEAFPIPPPVADFEAYLESGIVKKKRMLMVNDTDRYIFLYLAPFAKLRSQLAAFYSGYLMDNHLIDELGFTAAFTALLNAPGSEILQEKLANRFFVAKARSFQNEILWYLNHADISPQSNILIMFFLTYGKDTDIASESGVWSFAKELITAYILRFEDPLTGLKEIRENYPEFLNPLAKYLLTHHNYFEADAVKLLIEYHRTDKRYQKQIAQIVATRFNQEDLEEFWQEFPECAPNNNVSLKNNARIRVNGGAALEDNNNEKPKKDQGKKNSPSTPELKSLPQFVETQTRMSLDEALSSLRLAVDQNDLRMLTPKILQIVGDNVQIEKIALEVGKIHRTASNRNASEDILTKLTSILAKLSNSLITSHVKSNSFERRYVGLLALSGQDSSRDGNEFLNMLAPLIIKAKTSVKKAAIDLGLGVLAKNNIDPDIADGFWRNVELFLRSESAMPDDFETFISLIDSPNEHLAGPSYRLIKSLFTLSEKDSFSQKDLWTFTKAHVLLKQNDSEDLESPLRYLSLFLWHVPGFRSPVSRSIVESICLDTPAQDLIIEDCLRFEKDQGRFPIPAVVRNRIGGNPYQPNPESGIFEVPEILLDALRSSTGEQQNLLNKGITETPREIVEDIQAAMENISLFVAMQYELSQGRIPIDVAPRLDEFHGCDILSYDARTGKVRKIEVKSKKEGLTAVSFSDLQVNTASEYAANGKDYFVFHVSLNLKTGPQALSIYHNPDLRYLEHEIVYRAGRNPNHVYEISELDSSFLTMFMRHH